MPHTTTSLLLCVACALADESYVTFQEMSFSTFPEARALSVGVIQSTVAETAMLGRYAWIFGGLDNALSAIGDLWRYDMLL